MKSGFSLYLNPKCDSSRSLYSKRSSQVDLIRFFSRIISPGATIIDVGANIGYLTTYFSDLTANSGKVLALEPDSRAFCFLKRNLSLNNCVNTTPYLLALSDHVGTSNLYLSSNRTGNNVLYELSKDRLDEPQIRSSVVVETTTLDEIFVSTTFTDQTILKIDVEGFELNVLRGAEQLLKSVDNLITVMEYTPRLMLQAGTSLQDFSNFCEDHKLLVFQIMPGGNLLSLDAQGLKQLNRKLMSNPDNFLHEDLVLVNENNSDDLLLRNVTT